MVKSEPPNVNSHNGVAWATPPKKKQQKKKSKNPIQQLRDRNKKYEDLINQM